MTSEVISFVPLRAEACRSKEVVPGFQNSWVKGREIEFCRERPAWI
jgi:hypothetical protein